MSLYGTFFQTAGGEEARAMRLAQCERVRNVLDNRGLVYDEETVARLADRGEEALREYLILKGVAPQSPLASRSDAGMATGHLTD